MASTIAVPAVDIIIPTKVNTAFTQMKTDIETLQAGTGVVTSFVAAGSTKTLDATSNNKVVQLDTLAGSVVTLPAATGSGVRFKFIITVVATSNSHVIKVANANDTMIGVIFNYNTTGNATSGFATASTSDTITLNRSTMGSKVKGECIDVVDIAANKWAVSGWVATSGTSATPFSAGV